MPCSSSAMEISLETIPTIDTGMAYGRDSLPAVVEEFGVLALGDVDAAGAAADEHAGARLIQSQPGVAATPRSRR